jgi:hypothetical protein
MYTMDFNITIGSYTLGLLDKVEIRKSVEVLCDTATITLPAAMYNQALSVEDKIKRGDEVVIQLGYKETGLREEFRGYLRKISTDGGRITLYCEDALFLTRKSMANEVLQNVTVNELLQKVVTSCNLDLEIDNSYSWTYKSFVINYATGLDVLKKIQEECGADIYIKDGVLHVHPPGEEVGEVRYYDFAYNIEDEQLTYRTAADKKISVIVKAVEADGIVKEVECGATGGERIEVRCGDSSTAAMQERGDAEVKRRTYDGYEGNITGWLIPACEPSDSVIIHDYDYSQKDGKYFVAAVTTTFSRDGGKREITLGFRLL